MRQSTSLMDYLRLAGNPEHEMLCTTKSKSTYACIHKWWDAGRHKPVYSTRETTLILPTNLYLRRQYSQPSAHTSMRTSSDTMLSRDILVASPTASESGYSTASSITTTSYSRRANSLLATKPYEKATITSTFTSLTTQKMGRRNITQAHCQRRDIRNWDSCYKLANKIGTLTLHALKEKDINLAHLNSADEIAQEVNQMFQCDLVSGRGISDTVANGDVGKSPPKRGRPCRIDDETMKDIAILLFTAQTIDQANGVPDRLRRTECASVIG